MAATNSGISAYWRMEEASTGTRADATGNGFGLTDVNTSVTQAATGIQGAGTTFAGGINAGGTLPYFTVPSGAFSTLDSFSMSFWIKPQTLNQGAKAVLFSFIQNTVAYVYCSLTTTGAVEVIAANLSSAVTLTSTITINTTVFHHIVVTYQKGFITLYIDGVFAGQVSPSSTSILFLRPSEWSGYTLFIGRPRASDTSFYYFKGDMDEVILYGRSLNPYDVSNLYNAGAGISYSTLTGLSTDPIPAGHSGTADFSTVAELHRETLFGSLSDAPLPVSGQLAPLGA